MSAFNFRKRLSVYFLFFVFLAFLFSSCTRSVGISIDERLSEVDALIQLSDYDEAWSLLKKIAKSIHGSYETLGVVRRALLLQKEDFAKDLLIDALGSSPENQELIAVYTHMLLSEKDYETALKYAPLLEDGSYGSLYSELRFIIDTNEIKKINSEKQKGEEHDTLNYYSENYIQAYIDIAKSTDNPDYLRNVALVYALQGNMKTAYSFHPKNITTYEKPWFWAQISYDAHEFYQVLSDLDEFELTSAEMALLADTYVHLGLFENAQQVWHESTTVFLHENPIAWHNTALYYQNVGEQKKANDTILHLVNAFPNYVEGLAAYSKFSLNKTIPLTESIFSPLLEERGLKTIQMENNETIPLLDARDALFRIEDAILSANEHEKMNLIIERLKLTWQISTDIIPSQQKVADVWRLLEENVLDPYGYPTTLIQYAVWFFLTQGMIEEADALFTTHCTSLYETQIDKTLGYTKTPVEGMKKWEYEYGAYIALKQNRFLDAQNWYSALIPQNIVLVTTSIPAVLNFAMLCDTLGKRSTALSLYEQITPFVRNSDTKADIFYRLALLQQEAGETQKARISLEEALTIDPNHAESRLLLKQRIK